MASACCNFVGNHKGKIFLGTFITLGIAATVATTVIPLCVVKTDEVAQKTFANQHANAKAVNLCKPQVIVPVVFGSLAFDALMVLLICYINHRYNRGDYEELASNERVGGGAER